MNCKTEGTIPFEYSPLDAVTGGMKSGELALVAGRPGMGKTSFVVNIAYNLTRKGLKTLFVFLETDRDMIKASIYS